MFANICPVIALQTSPIRHFGAFARGTAMYTRSKARELREYGWKVSHAKCDHQHPIGPTPGQHVRLRKGATRELVGEWDALMTRVRGLP